MTSVRQAILSNVITALNSITIAGGYQNGPGAWAYRVSDALAAKTFPRCIVEVLSESKADEAIGDRVRADLRMAAYCLVGVNDDLDEQTVVDSYLSDIEVALNVDEQRGGLAIDTYIEEVEFVPLDDSPGEAVGIVTFMVQYDHRKSDPRVSA